MSNFHFDLSLKHSQEEVHDFSGEVENDFRGGVPPPHTHLLSKSGYAQAEQSSLKIELFCFCEEFKVLFTVIDRLNAAHRISAALG
jgi:hypothetical protein